MKESGSVEFKGCGYAQLKGNCSVDNMFINRNIIILLVIGSCIATFSVNYELNTAVLKLGVATLLRLPNFKRGSQKFESKKKLALISSKMAKISNILRFFF